MSFRSDNVGIASSGNLKDQDMSADDKRSDDMRLMELMITATKLAVPVLALVIVIIFSLGGIYFVYFDPKYNF